MTSTLKTRLIIGLFVLQVIGFEGNAGFYEMGCTGTPLDLNYSVLGWNHPGFGGSSVSDKKLVI